jgi:hypothetical protein
MAREGGSMRWCLVFTITEVNIRSSLQQQAAEIQVAML